MKSTAYEGTISTLSSLGNPQDKLRIIHVAGTNGKGSVCVMLDTILQASGYKVGLFTSPHLINPSERIRINGKKINEEEFIESLAYIKKLNSHKAHFSEIYTVMAFEYFARNKVDFAIMETGVGGRLDPTNVINKPLLTVITAIGYDHQEILGNTLEQIASEKAGILKKNCPVVFPNIILNELKTAAKKKNAPIYNSGDVKISIMDYSINNTVFSASLPGYQYEKLTLSLLGKHQLENAAQVLMSVQALRDAGVHLSDEAVITGLMNVKWPGRFEVFPGMPTVVLDGAHNINGAERFCQALELYFPYNPVTLVLGMVKEKDTEGILKALYPILKKAECIICTQPETPRALSASQLSAYINYKTITIASPDEAFREAKNITKKEGIIAAAGSLYLLGAYYRLIEKR